MDEVESTDKKTKSRKFIVWIVSGILTLIVCGVVLTTVIITKTLSDTMAELLKISLTYYFWESLFYMGANVGQKIGLNLTDKKTEETKNNTSKTTEKEGER